MNKTLPSYTEEFKRDAVRLVETSGKLKTQIARELGISDSALYRWLKAYGQAQGRARMSKAISNHLPARAIPSSWETYSPVRGWWMSAVGQASTV